MIIPRGGLGAEEDVAQGGPGGRGRGGAGRDEEGGSAAGAVV